ncbi:hypothetical protein J6590_015109 [Homalodisca vitripennis]|nr:hypothetical protein J6590_015109 [Homalodisca vitripennis]
MAVVSRLYYTYNGEIVASNEQSARSIAPSADFCTVPMNIVLRLMNVRGRDGYGRVLCCCQLFQPVNLLPGPLVHHAAPPYAKCHTSYSLRAFPFNGEKQIQMEIYYLSNTTLSIPHLRGRLPTTDLVLRGRIFVRQQF